ncbi:hypothetical protein M3J09_013252 [Ascochyta lentis]
MKHTIITCVLQFDRLLACPVRLAGHHLATTIRLLAPEQHREGLRPAQIQASGILRTTACVISMPSVAFEEREAFDFHPPRLLELSRYQLQKILRRNDSHTVYIVKCPSAIWGCTKEVVEPFVVLVIHVDQSGREFWLSLLYSI